MADGQNLSLSENSTLQDRTSLHPEVKVWPLTDDTIFSTSINNIAFYGVLYPVALVGNLFTLITVILVLRKKKSIPNLLIGVLAAADLMSLFLVHLLSVISMVRGEWMGEVQLCRFQSVMTFTYFKLGFFNKTNISMDRFIALNYPLRYKSLVTSRRVVVLIVFHTIFSVGSSFLTWIIDPEYIHQLETWYMCTNDFSIYTDYKRTIVLLEGGLFILGFIGFIISDIKIVQVMKGLVDRKLGNQEVGSTMESSQSADTMATVLDDKNETISSYEPADKTKCMEQKEQIEQLKHYDNQSSDSQPPHRLSNISLAQIILTFSNDSQRPSTVSTASRHCEPVNQRKVLKIRKYVVNTKHQSSGNITSELPERYRKMSAGALDSSASKKFSLKRSNTSSNILSRMLSLSKRPLKQLLRDRERYRQQKEIQYAKLVLVMVIVFVILWTPLMVTIYYEHFMEVRVHPLMTDISMKLGFANAVINPILYGLFNVNYRRAYVYYIGVILYYLTCKRMKLPSTQDLPWVSSQPQPAHRKHAVSIHQVNQSPQLQ